MTRSIILLFLFAFVVSCITRKKQEYFGCFYESPKIPYPAILRQFIDSTYDYQVIKNPIRIKLPRDTFGKVYKGFLEFSVLIDEHKQFSNIYLLDYELYDKDNCKFKHSFNKSLQSEFEIKVKNHLYTVLKEVPFIATKKVAAGNHETYCWIYLVANY